MPPRNFKPPSYVETCYCVFDRRTGEILATETRWIDQGAKLAEPGVSRELLRMIARDSGRKVSDLDVLQAEPPAQYLQMRVDVSKRKLTPVRASRKVVVAALPLAKP